VASRYYPEKPEVYPIAMHFAKQAAANGLISGKKSVELALAYMLLAYYAGPAKRWEDQRSWLYVGLGIRVATDLNLHQTLPAKPTNEREERELLNRVRVWMNCYVLDRSGSIYNGRPFTFQEDHIIRSASQWYNSSRYNSPCDIGLCAYVSMLKITSGFREEIFSDPDAPGGFNKKVAVLEVTMKFDVLLSKFMDEWEDRFSRDVDLTNPQTLFRRHLLPYVTSYSRLVMWSFAFERASERGIEDRDRIMLDKCFETASRVISVMVHDLAPSGFMRNASESHYLFAVFASSFLLKLLKPEFAKLVGDKRRFQIFETVEQLIQTYTSVEVATDDQHTPRQQARFLSTLLPKYRKKRGKGVPQGTSASQRAGGSDAGAPTGPGQLIPAADASQLPPGTQDSSVYDPSAQELPMAGFDLPMSFDDDLLGALDIFKNPDYWEGMMMPGHLGAGSSGAR